MRKGLTKRLTAFGLAAAFLLSATWTGRPASTAAEKQMKADGETAAKTDLDSLTEVLRANMPANVDIDKYGPVLMTKTVYDTDNTDAFLENTAAELSISGKKKDVQYKLYDIDGDATKEMLVSYEAGVRMGVTIFRYDTTASAVRKIKAFTSVSAVYSNKKKHYLTVQQSEGADAGFYTAFKMNKSGTKLKKLVKYSFKGKTYKKGKKKISKNAFEKQLNKYVKSGEILINKAAPKQYKNLTKIAEETYLSKELYYNNTDYPGSSETNIMQTGGTGSKAQDDYLAFKIEYDKYGEGSNVTYAEDPAVTRYILGPAVKDPATGKTYREEDFEQLRLEHFACSFVPDLLSVTKDDNGKMTGTYYDPTAVKDLTYSKNATTAPSGDKKYAADKFEFKYGDELITILVFSEGPHAGKIADLTSYIADTNALYGSWSFLYGEDIPIEPEWDPIISAQVSGDGVDTGLTGAKNRTLSVNDKAEGSLKDYAFTITANDNVAYELFDSNAGQFYSYKNDGTKWNLPMFDYDEKEWDDFENMLNPQSGQMNYADSAFEKGLFWEPKATVATSSVAPTTLSLAGIFGWEVQEMVTGLKIDKETYIIGQDKKIIITFSVRKAIEPDDPNYGDDLVFSINAKNANSYMDDIELASQSIPLKDLKVGENTFEFPYEFATEEKHVYLYAYRSGSAWDSASEMPSFSVQKKKEGGTDTDTNTKYTDYWSLKEQVTGIKADKTTYTTGSEQTINVSFNVGAIPDDSCSEKDNDLFFIIASGSLDTSDFEAGDLKGKKDVVSYQSVKVSSLKCGSNKVAIKTRFENKGAYYLYIIQDGYSVWDKVMSKAVSFTVTAPTDDSGKVINTKASIRPEFSVYSPKQAATMKVYYTVNDSSSKYHLYIRKGLSVGEYDNDQKYTVADFMSDQGNMKTEIGKEQNVQVKGTNSDFSYIGVYTAVLYNMTTAKIVASQKFYVIYEKFVIQRDVTKMQDDGTIPFYCDADLRNLDMDKDEKYSFKVCFPLNYNKYYKELENLCDYKGEDSNLDYGQTISADDFTYGAFLSDKYEVKMKVGYVPEGSKDSRLLFTKKVTDLYSAHTITLSSQEIMKKIYETGPYDIAYAGVVTVTFTNEDDYQYIENDAIVKFTDSFKFGVSKAENLTSVKPDATKVELEYGGAFYYRLTDTLGGTIVQEIYKGKEMIDSAEMKCQINSDGTAGIHGGWDLRDINGNYAEAGDYTAKVYTVNKYTYFEEDGSASEKTITSEKKTLNFTVTKPNRKLTLSTKVSGDSGGNAVYVEKPIVGVVVKANIGVSTIISVRNSKGIEIRNSSAVFPKGQRATSLDLSGSRMKPGKYKVVVTAETLDGQKKKSTTSFHVRKLPKSKIQNVSVSANSSSGIGTASFKISEYADVTVLIKSGKKIVQTVLDQSYSAGAIKTSFSIGGFAPGNYNLVIKTQNSGGKRTVTKSFNVPKKPVIVKKPTASNLSVRFLNSKDGDMVKGTFNYTGKGAKVIIDIMYNDTEEIVYTYQGVTKNDSGTFTYTWDGYKSNGFRCWPGNYTYRVHLVNSAGSTPYLRQTFELAAG